MPETRACREAVDMLRKLALVGLVLLAGRGSIGQLVCALLLAFVFFALQVRLCPYKIDQDNTLRASTELHVFLIIVAALVLQKTDLSREEMDADTYNWLLAVSFALLVPFAFIVAVCSKVMHLNRVLASSDSHQEEASSARVAFDRAFVGLANATDIEVLNKYLDNLRVQLSSADFVHVITGQKWKSMHPSAETQQPAAAELITPLGRAGTNASLKPELSNTHDTNASQSAEDDPRDGPDDLIPTATNDHAGNHPDTYYSKFDTGFEGTFADMADYYGGLEKLIGECRKDLMQAMQEEHCDVMDGFGRSDGMFVTSSYRVETCPRQEWLFVSDPAQIGELSAGVDRDTGRARGSRTKVAPEHLLANAGELITESFQRRGFHIVVTQEQIESLPLLLEEIIAMRLYTGESANIS